MIQPNNMHVLDFVWWSSDMNFMKANSCRFYNIFNHWKEKPWHPFYADEWKILWPFSWHVHPVWYVRTFCAAAAWILLYSSCTFTWWCFLLFALSLLHAWKMPLIFLNSACRWFILCCLVLDDVWQSFFLLHDARTRLFWKTWNEMIIVFVVLVRSGSSQKSTSNDQNPTR